MASCPNVHIAKEMVELKVLNAKSAKVTARNTNQENNSVPTTPKDALKLFASFTGTG